MPTASQVPADAAFETRLFWEQHRNTIIAVAAIVLLAGLGFAGYELYSARRASDAAALLAAAKSAPDYQQVIERYPGSPPAASAYLLLATAQRAKQDYAGANLTLHKFIEQFPKHELITTAWMGVAANLESLGKPDDALSTYQRLVAEYPQSFNAPVAMLAEVPLLKAKNRNEEARRLCETLLTQYRESALASEAMRELRTLKPAASAPSAVPAAAVAPPLLARPPETPPAAPTSASPKP